MGNRIAEFDKVSYLQFLDSCLDVMKFNNDKNNFDIKEYIKNIYEQIKLPTRATKGSAGYDFKCPFDINLKPGESIKIPTGVRCRMDGNWVLCLYPRSSFGFKYRMQLNNTVGIIDSDYFNSANEGHIIVKITNDSKENTSLVINRGDGFVQGIFVQYGITLNDKTDGKRDGGFEVQENNIYIISRNKYNY